MGRTPQSPNINSIANLQNIVDMKLRQENFNNTSDFLKKKTESSLVDYNTAEV